MRKKLLFTICAICLYQSAFSQNSAATAVQSVFVYSVLKYVEWAEDDVTTDMSIVILGDSPVYDALLDASKTKKIGSRKISVKKVTDVNSIEKCHILYVSTGWINSLDEITQKSTCASAVIVTNRDGALRYGSDLNFFQQNGKLAFQLNEKSLAGKKLKVSSSLSSLAVK